MTIPQCNGCRLVEWFRLYCCFNGQCHSFKEVPRNIGLFSANILHWVLVSVVLLSQTICPPNHLNPLLCYDDRIIHLSCKSVPLTDIFSIDYFRSTSVNLFRSSSVWQKTLNIPSASIVLQNVTTPVTRWLTLPHSRFPLMQTRRKERESRSIRCLEKLTNVTERTNVDGGV